MVVNTLLDSKIQNFILKKYSNTFFNFEKIYLKNFFINILQKSQLKIWIVL